jgi:CheY-like chemotaxis protein
MDSLTGKQVLLVEDEALIAMSIEDMLVELGCHVVGPAMSPATARALALAEPVDAAILDLNLNGRSGLSVAELLQQRSVPFCFSTGYGLSGVPAQFCNAPILQKPYTMEALGKALRKLI